MMGQKDCTKMTVGGQAVIEGVMMRGPKYVATAVREPSGQISIKRSPVNSFGDKYPILKKPFLRGILSLAESLVIGMQSLSYSAKMAGEEEEDKLSDKDMAVTILVSLAAAVILFIVIPTAAAKFFPTDNPIYRNLGEGILRLLIFLLYIYAISRIKDIYRVFQYHGAEHKTIFAYEAGVPLLPENIKPFPRFHPRCGTSFLLIVMLVSIVAFAFLGWPDLLYRILSRIILLPVIAGISYEIIRLSARSDNRIIHLATLPGLWLQRLTTREPDCAMIEVAVKAVEAVLVEEKAETSEASNAASPSFVCPADNN
ncbi:DUF1385 domain-containing protein [Pectinatus frisingensis]|jgi:uncharacterized protein YqhQ|uniref:DUF1385 domain-containing protein n=2 Tax=Pectinatus frisingensis TaxID=865 RepID=UPI001E40C6FF|nr:DUF1385 domain-containing protein [Pectinatus frisingensis]